MYNYVANCVYMDISSMYVQLYMMYVHDVRTIVHDVYECVLIMLLNIMAP